MSQVLSSVISDHTVTFFAQSRMFTIQSDHINYKTIRDHLIAEPYAEAGPLIELADVRVAIQNADPEGLLQVRRRRALVQGQASSAASGSTKSWASARRVSPSSRSSRASKACSSNPSMRARERFPIFAEVSGFGFLKDGRMGAFKAVRADFLDIHSGKFDNSPGKVVSMPREDVDDDPEKTCSAGFHLGALSYVQNFGHITTNGDTSNKVVFCAFWPEHVVAIPVDYDGKKMRVWQYEVLEEVAPESVQEFLKARSLIINPTEVKTSYQIGYAKGYADGDYGAELASHYADNADEQRGYNAGHSDGEEELPFDDTDRGVEPEDDRSPYDRGYAHGHDDCSEGAECDPSPEIEASDLDPSDYNEYRRGYRARYVNAENTN